MKKIVLICALPLLAFMLTGCASKEHRHPDDPLEPMNRAVFSFNDGVDRMVLKPIATGYKTVTPAFARRHVSNAFNNAGGIWSTVNAGFQLKAEKFLIGFFRFGVNTIFGFGGLVDIASEIGLDDTREDFGQTLGYWGVKSGPYIVWPLLGSSTVRDSVGSAVDIAGNPLVYIDSDKVTYSLLVLDVVNMRAQLLDAESAAQASMFDKYVFFRDAYLQRRQSLVYDGNPPMSFEFDFTGDDLYLEFYFDDDDL